MQQSVSYFFLVGLFMTGAALWGRWAATEVKLRDSMTDFFLRTQAREVFSRIVIGVGSWNCLWYLLTGLTGETGRIVVASNALMVVVMLWVSTNNRSKYAANDAAKPIFVRNPP